MKCQLLFQKWSGLDSWRNLMVVNWHSSLDISYWQTTSWEDFWIHFFGFWWDLSGSVSLTPCKVFVRSSRWWFIWLRPVAVNWMVCCGSCEQYVPSSSIENPMVVANHYVVVDGDQILCGGWRYGQGFSFETHKFACCLHTLLLEMLAGENRDALDHEKLLADMKISIPHLEVPTCSKQRHVLTCS